MLPPYFYKNMKYPQRWYCNMKRHAWNNSPPPPILDSTFLEIKPLCQTLQGGYVEVLFHLYSHCIRQSKSTGRKIKVAAMIMLTRKAQIWFGFTYHGVLRNLTQHTKWQPCEKGTSENIAQNCIQQIKIKIHGFFSVKIRQHTLNV